MDIPDELLAALRAAGRVAVLTGAGISAESGVPTFREAQTGLWARHRPEELATPEAFRRDPKLVWEWYQWRRELVSCAQPNPGHVALARLERRFQSYCLITQNVDGLHRRAGSMRVVELHGNLNRTRCLDCGREATEWVDDGQVPPRCPACGGLLRPDVVWFNERLPADALRAALEAAQTCDVFLSIGTSGLVEPAASLPVEALRRGAVVVEINPSPTPLSDRAAFTLRGPSGVILPELAARLGAPTD
jgi:NAD-dependent deacetylase